MKLTARDSGAFLKAPDAKSVAVLLYGPDAGLIRERSRAIASTLLGNDSDPINHIELSADQVKADPALLRDELSALSLMAGRRLVVIRDAGDKLTASIESALDGLDTTTYLIVESDELTPSSSLRQFFEKEPRCAALACYRDEGRGLEETIRGALSSYGLRAHSDAMQYLITHLGNDRGITLSEIDKIALYMGEHKEVALHDAMKLIGHNAAEGLEDICHAVACGNAKESQALLARILHEGTQPVAIVRALLRHFQRLDIATAHMGAGQTLDQALGHLRPAVFFRYTPPMKRALSLWNSRSLAQAMGLLLKSEKDLKSRMLSPALVAGHTLSSLAQMVAA